jgi:hypothetical protein
MGGESIYNTVCFRVTTQQLVYHKLIAGRGGGGGSGSEAAAQVDGSSDNQWPYTVTMKSKLEYHKNFI